MPDKTGSLAGGVSRRRFGRMAVVGAAAALLEGRSLADASPPKSLRLGAIGLMGRYAKFQDPAEWVALHGAWGFRAADCPVPIGSAAEVVRDYARAADKADLVIGQVGAWSNPISLDEKTRAQGVTKCIEGLRLADEIGAVCCVNASGSLGSKLADAHPGNLTEETFALIVDSVRTIIDSVKPRRACYALEPMPYTYPNSTQTYRRLVDAIDRPAFAVQFDPVNIINSPEKYYDTAGVVEEFVRELGPRIKCSHLKGVKLQSKVTVHIDEVRVGTGGFDVAAFLRAIASLEDVPILIEHLPSEEEFRLAAEHTRSVAAGIGISL